MATFYLDYEGGSDAADGTTFANRWKTITNGATAARIAPGDVVRIMGSPAPTSLGISATWTNKSPTVTLSSALNVLITNCDTAWTASANVTATADTSVYRTSTASASLAVASGFTTGKIAYFDLGANQDYSAYQGVTLWLGTTVGTIPASTIDLRLCSDTTGDTVVDTLTLPAVTQTGQWIPVHINKGSALGNSIRSISLSASSDPGTVTIVLDNISTTKAVGNDCLTLKTLLGKNGVNTGWWGLRSISGTTLTLDQCPTMTPGHIARGFAGTTESVTTYIRQTIPTDLVATISTNVQTVQDSGSLGNLITFSGGWNRTDMSTQTLETWFDGQSGHGRGLSVGTTFIALTNLMFTRYDIGVLLANTDLSLGNHQCNNCGWGVSVNSVARLTHSGTLLLCQNLHGAVLAGSNFLDFDTVTALGAGTTSFNGYGLLAQTSRSEAVRFKSYTAKNCFDGINGSVSVYHYRFDVVDTSDNARYGFIVDWDLGNISVGSLTATGNGSYGLYLGKGQSVFGSVTTSGNTTGAIDGGAEENFDAYHDILKSSLAETTKLQTVLWTGSYRPGGGIRFTNFNGTAGDHRTYIGGGTTEVFSESSVRHTASGLAWKISPKIALTSVWNPPVPIARIAVNANQTLTVSVWMRRTNTGLSGELFCPGLQIAGIPLDVQSSISAAADTWQQVSIVVTPTENGVLDFYVRAYGGTTYSLYVDDFSAVQG